MPVTTTTKTKLECVHSAMDWIDANKCLASVAAINTDQHVSIRIRSGAEWCKIFVLEGPEPTSTTQWGRLWEIDLGDFTVTAFEAR